MNKKPPSLAEVKQKYAEYQNWFNKKKAEGKSGIDEIKASGLCFIIDDNYFPEILGFGQWCLKTADPKLLKEAVQKNIKHNQAFFKEEAKYVSHAGKRELRNPEYAKRQMDIKLDNEFRKQLDVNYQAEIVFDEKVLFTRKPHDIEYQVQVIDKSKPKKLSRLGTIIKSLFEAKPVDLPTTDPGIRASEFFGDKK